MNQAQHIILIGFMGSGKSTVARRLARELGMSSIDMDKYIQRSSDLTIPEIFAKEGEAGFRARETAFLKTMFNREPSILSCGGGVVTTKESRELLGQLGWVVHLKVDVKVALARIGDKQSRPLLRDEAGARELLDRREHLYAELADACIDTSELTIAEVVKQVMQALSAREVK